MAFDCESDRVSRFCLDFSVSGCGVVMKLRNEVVTLTIISPNPSRSLPVPLACGLEPTPEGSVPELILPLSGNTIPSNVVQAQWPD